MEMKKYMSILRLGHKKTTQILNEGDEIVIQEKLDGANASIRRVGNELTCFSRYQEITSENKVFKKFHDYVKSLNISIGEGLILFGEWLDNSKPNKIKYDEHGDTFWLFDIYNIEEKRYLPFSEVKRIGESLGLNIVPTFYEGEYRGFDHLESFLGKSELNGKIGKTETGEGIVVKRANYVDRFGDQQFVKLVTESFREVQKQKKAKDPKKEGSLEQVFVLQTLTKARVDKMMIRLIDEGVISTQFGIEDMKVILKNMSPLIKEDILKEESEMLPDDYDEKKLSRAIGKILPKMIKEIIREKEESEDK